MLNVVFVKKFFPLVLCISFFLSSEGRTGQSRPTVRKNVIKTIKSSYGDVFDCVDMYKQPSFDHPLLKDHKLQMKPTFEPKGLLDSTLPENQFPQFKEECPDGYVPVQRTERGDLEGSNYSLGIKAPVLSTQDSTNDFKSAFAVTKTAPRSFGWVGGGAHLNVYSLPQVGKSQMSSNMFSVINTDQFTGVVILTAGWMVYPKMYNDTRPRLTIAWNMTGTMANCYNLQCPGFFQLNKNIFLGSIIEPTSEYMGRQYTTNVYIFKDETTGNWWFSYGDPGKLVGYWPKEIFPKGFDVAEQMTFGGYVAGPANENLPVMGNGVFPSKLPNDTACYVGEVVASNIDMEMSTLVPVDVYSDSSTDCYGVGGFLPLEGKDAYWFAFGGPECKNN